MPRTRKNVWKLTQPWDDTLLWYARAVGELQKRPITDPTSWNSLGAMHGFRQELWTAFGYVTPTTPLPSPAVRARLWQQCQHQTWYFLPWHRGYLGAFEAIIRDAIAKLGGPSDWALPYWNYSADAQSLQLPPAFAAKQLPSGGDNPLFTPRRYGRGDGTVVIDPRDVLLGALNERYYTGTGPNGATGFGGLKTEFNHFAAAQDATHNYNGQLEARPHGIVHVRVGGYTDPNDSHKWGLMTNPDTAALDPIFWLHHANIDRLWKVWLRQTAPAAAPPDQFHNPTDTAWLDGPLDRKFVMPKPDGTEFTFTSRGMLDTTAPALDYIYDDDTSPQPAANALVARFERLGVPAGRAAEFAGAVRMSPLKTAELVGANQSVVRLNDATVETKVQLDSAVRNNLAASLRVESLAVAAPREPDRVYLNLENIKSPTDAAVIYVYVNLPAGAKPEDHPESFAGAVSLFGASKSTASDGTHGGNGISESLDITRIVDALHVTDALGPELTVQFVAGSPGAMDNVTIDRVSVYRQGD
jgi:tyrosinase